MDSPPDTTPPVVTPTLSILLATVVSRCDLFAKLHAHIAAQAAGKPVEIVVACDNKEISIGKKRQNLLEQATGDYVCFVDDDDWVADNYVDAILKALETKPDCVGFEIICTSNGGNPEKAIASMRYPKWTSGLDGYSHNRSTYHKTPHRRDFALQVGFRDLRYGEDRFYSEGLMKLVKTEVFIPKQLYHYRYRKENFNTKYGIARSAKFNPADRSQKGIVWDHKRRPFQH